jgi:hypothetical protein
VNVEDLTTKAQNRLFKTIFSGLTQHFEHNPASLPIILEDLVEMLDELDNDDFLGTEGWKHNFGVNR